jgi:hypothetical protein
MTEPPPGAREAADAELAAGKTSSLDDVVAELDD